jgi:hypothetical protein
MQTMTKYKKALIAAATAAALIAAGAARAEDRPKADQQKPTPQQIAADKDFGKLSAEGSAAFQDLSLARLAIYDGRVDEAKKFVKRAETAFNNAKTDETVYNKAESELKPPVDKVAAANKSAAPAEPADAKEAAKLKTPIAWLPVDGSIVIDDDYKPSASKTEAVADANKSLKGGDRKEAVEKLKLADIKVVIVVAVLPVEQTIDKVNQAGALINEGKYYEASQELRQAQAGERFDVVDEVAPVSK